jgi:hypothetical protein
MNNEDFRKLLQQPRAVKAEPEAQRTKEDKETTTNKNDRNGEQTRSWTDKTLEDFNAKYVDRAELRRKGVEDLGEDPLAMKGLDFSVLAKARAEQQQKLLAAKEARAESVAARSVADGVVFNREVFGAAGPSHAADKSAIAQKSIHGRRVAQAIEAALVEVTKDKLSNHQVSFELTSYVYKWGDDKYEIPVIRRKALSTGKTGARETHLDTADVRRRPLPNSLVDEVCAIMRYCSGTVRTEGRGKTPGARSMLSLPVAPPHADRDDKERKGEIDPSTTIRNDMVEGLEDDEDIFGDAGTDYVPTATNGPDAAKKPASYFAGSAAAPGTAAKVEGCHYEQDKGTVGVGVGGIGSRGRDDDDGIDPVAASLFEQRATSKVDRRQMDADGYEECYPDYFDGGMDVASDVDEEPEEEAPALMTKKARKTANKKEQLRLDSEMASIQKIFDDKGYKHFTNEPVEKPLMHKAPKKKRRI